MTCAFPDCDRPIKSGGWCSGHYMQHYRGREMRPLYAPHTPIKPTCIGPECSRDAVYVSERLCRAHYTQRRTQGELSPILTKRAAAREAATKRTQRPRPTVCQGPECDRPGPLTRGLCQTHYQQQHTTGETWPIGSRRSGPKQAFLAHRVADAHDLLDAGVQPEEVASRLGTTVGALDRLMRRHGQPSREMTRAANAASRPRKPRAKAAPKLCSFDGCDRPTKARNLCSGHWQQDRDGRALRPLVGPGSYRERGQTAPLKLPDNVLPLDRPRPEGLPAGWFKPSTNPKRKPTAPTAKSVGQIIDVPPRNPLLEQMARENLIRLGAGDLLDMLGLEAS